MRSIIVVLALLAPSLAFADDFDGSAVNGYNTQATPDWGSNAQLPDYQRDYSIPYGVLPSDSDDN